MDDQRNEEPFSLSKREFLQGFASLGGMSAVMAALDAWGIGIASAASAPPVLSGRAQGTRVVILGAGLAGLTTAYELTERGYDCHILEARPVAGGRCQTARAGFELGELDREVQTCGFDEGLYFNHGPWRIPMEHRSLLYYCRKFGIPLQVMINANEQAYLLYENAPGPLAGRRLRRREVMADMRGYTSELLAKLADQGALDDRLTSEDKEQLTEYLVMEGFLDPEDLTYKGTTERGYAEEPGNGLNPGLPSEALALRELLQSGLGNTFRGVPSIERPYTLFQPVGGMDLIARAFEERVGHMITYNAEVQELRQSETGVQISYKDTRTGEVTTESGNYCVTTIPLAIMRGISNDFSERCKAAITATTSSQVGKLALQMNRRFWEEDDHIFGGSSQTDIPGHSVIYPSNDYLAEKGIVQGYYNFGPDALGMSEQPPDARVEFGLANGEKIHPGQFRQHYDGQAFSVAWHNVQYSSGGWETWSAEARREHFPVLLEAQGRTFFAGAYLSYLTGWQAGAIESAWYQIEQLHGSAVIA